MGNGKSGIIEGRPEAQGADFFQEGSYYAFYKGRVALYAILKALGIGPGDEVIVPGFTCVVVPSAVVFIGAKPVYIDIDEKTYNLKPEKLEPLITSRTRAVIVQHTFGLPADVERIRYITRSRNVAIIEDCAHCLGSRLGGEWLGSLGDAAFFSSQWSKPVTTGLGGFAVVNDSALAEKMRIIQNSFPQPGFLQRILLRSQFLAHQTCFSPRRYWKLRKAYNVLSQMGLLIGSSGEEELALEKPINYELRMGPYQERLLASLLNDSVSLEKMINHRKSVSKIYENELGKIGFTAPAILPSSETVFLRFPVRVQNKKEILSRSQQYRLEIGDWFISPFHPNTGNLDKVGYTRGQCPQAEQVCQEVVNLPTHMHIDSEEISRVLAFFTKYAQIVH